jgi:hypothetical protein
MIGAHFRFGGGLRWLHSAKRPSKIVDMFK